MSLTQRSQTFFLKNKLLLLIFAAVSGFYYLRVVMVMYMSVPSCNQESESRVVLSPTATIVLACAVAGVVVLGVYPGPLVAVTLSEAIPGP